MKFEEALIRFRDEVWSLRAEVERLKDRINNWHSDKNTELQKAQAEADSFCKMAESYRAKLVKVIETGERLILGSHGAFLPGQLRDWNNLITETAAALEGK